MPKDRGIQLNDSVDSESFLDVKVMPIRGENGKIVSGMVIGNTLEQNKALILICQQGEVKLFPKIGVGIEDSLLSDDLLPFRHLIREHFNMDGLKISILDFYTGKQFRVDAKY